MSLDEDRDRIDDPRTMSQRELDEYLDRLVDANLDDTPEFEAAYAEWERRG